MVHLSIEAGRPVCVIRGDKSKLNNEVVYIQEKDKTEVKKLPKRDIDFSGYLRGKKLTPRERALASEKLRRVYENDLDDAALDEDLREILKQVKGDLVTDKEIILMDGAQFQHIPNPDTDRDVGYIFAPSGAGKSTYIRNYATEYKKLFPKREIYLFSRKNEDTSLDDIKPARIRIDDELVTSPLKVEEFEQSLVIFDDCDCISDKKHKAAVDAIKDEILEVGRSYKVSCLVVSHLASNYKDTRKILNECHFMTFFPTAGSFKGIEYILKNYCGLDKQQVQKIRKLPSRWVTLFKNYPQAVLSTTQFYLLN